MSNQQIFTYLLGAGASCKVLPLVKDFPERLEIFQQFIIKSFPPEIQHDQVIHARFADPKSKLLEDISSLTEEIRDHASVDTLAKKLYLTKDYEALFKLKSLIDLYLSIEQFKNGIDPRYDAFFAALLQKGNDGIKIPNNIRIITWNYDFQIELSLSNFLQINNSHTLEQTVQIVPRVLNLFEFNRFAIFKINGTAMGFVSSDNKFGTYRFDPTKLKSKFLNDKIEQPLKALFVEYFMRVYYSYPDSKHEPSIMYSWEQDTIVNYSRDLAKQILSVTDYLIVIGYSFPTFNRTADHEFLTSLRDSVKIFVQSPTEGINSVVQRINALSGKQLNIQQVTQTDEFFIPFEYL